MQLQVTGVETDSEEIINDPDVCVSQAIKLIPAAVFSDSVCSAARGF